MSTLKKQRRAGSLSILKESKETWSINVMCNPVLNRGPAKYPMKDIIGIIFKIWLRTVDQILVLW